MNRNKANNNKNKAFTLLEVIVAIAIMDIIALMLYSSLYIAVRAKRSSYEAIEPYNVASAAFEYIRKDLSCAVKPGGILAGDFVGELQTIAGGNRGDYLAFYTTSALTGSSRTGSDIVFVEYSLENEQEDPFFDDTNFEPSPTVLTRTITTNLLAPAISPFRSEVVAGDISSLRFRYYENEDWVDQWNSADTDNAIPKAVEVTITISSQDRRGVIDISYTKIFRLLAQTAQSEATDE